VCNSVTLLEGFDTTEACDRVFRALDNRGLSVGALSYRVLVSAICDADGHRWVQLTLSGMSQDASYGLLVRMPRAANADHVLTAVAGWLADPHRTEQVLRVA